VTARFLQKGAGRGVPIQGPSTLSGGSSSRRTSLNNLWSESAPRTLRWRVTAPNGSPGLTAEYEGRGPKFSGRAA